jgi:hypothetical protein
MTSQFAIYFIFVLARLERIINKHIITIIYLVLVLVLKTSFQNCACNKEYLIYYLSCPFFICALLKQFFNRQFIEIHCLFPYFEIGPKTRPMHKKKKDLQRNALLLFG